MEIRLPIYKGKEVVKTYTAETYDIMFGTVEDLFDVLDVEKLASNNDRDFLSAILIALPKIFGIVKPLLKEMFEGLTDDDIKHCRLKDVARVLMIVISYSIGQISGGTDSKN